MMEGFQAFNVLALYTRMIESYYIDSS